MSLFIRKSRLYAHPGHGAAPEPGTSSETRFCLSCHEMGPYGQSMHVDDDELLVAAHFQNRRVPQDTACYTCHRDYAMFGTINTKLNGLKHVYKHFTGQIPEKMELYNPYSNNNCLHCHEGARSFEESKNHHSDEAPLVAIKLEPLSDQVLSRCCPRSR
ncbi:MAG: NapC/NirT family cytochrome c [Myxococcota bacterium]